MPKISAYVWHKWMVAMKILLLVGHKWVLLAHEGQKMTKQSKKVNKMTKVGKKCLQNHQKSSYKMSKKAIQQAKKVNKIFRFSKEFSASTWEGIWQSGWKFSILMHW